MSGHEARHRQRALDAVTWPKRTDRLVIRRMRADDAAAMWEYRRLEAVSRWLTWWEPDRDAFIEKIRHPDRLAVTLVVVRHDVIIGDLMLLIEDAWAQADVADEAKGVQAELGWALHPEYAGNGYATEAVHELIRICFDDLGLRRIIGQCFALNEPSWRLMERLGMRRELHAVGESLHRDLGWLDNLGYALLADEWRDRREV